MKVVDCRGLACPVPVLKTKEALEELEEGTVKVIVDNKASKENVRRFAEKMGCSVKVEEKNGEFHITIKKGNVESEKEEKTGGKGEKEVVVLVASTYVGEDRELGKILMRGFFNTFLNADPMPKKVILINTAVKFACGEVDEEVFNALSELSKRGVEIICCATCLNYFGLLDRVKVGVPSNAYDVVQAMVSADVVVRL